MNFVDATLVRLATPGSRRAVFDEIALRQLAEAAYDADALALDGPFDVVFDEFVLGGPPAAKSLVEGQIRQGGAIPATEAHLTVTGIGGAPPRVDALWRGAVLARYRIGGEPIVAVNGGWVSASGIDEEIVAAMGALPSDADDLEDERRARLLARIKAQANDPDTFGDAFLGRWLDSVGAGSAGDLLARFSGVVEARGVTVEFAPPAAVVAAPRQLPVLTVLLIRDTGFGVAELVVESVALRRRLEAEGYAAPAESDLRQRHGVTVAWVVPEAVFDDADWPGGGAGTAAQRRTNRRIAAGRWLGTHGIGLVAV